MVKKLEWTKPVLVELGSARRMSFGEIGIEKKPGCFTGTSADKKCDSGSAVFKD
jgi:hypothetical protein